MNPIQNKKDRTVYYYVPLCARIIDCMLWKAKTNGVAVQKIHQMFEQALGLIPSHPEYDFFYIDKLNLCEETYIWLYKEAINLLESIIEDKTHHKKKYLSSNNTWESDYISYGERYSAWSMVKKGTIFDNTRRTHFYKVECAYIIDAMLTTGEKVKSCQIHKTLLEIFNNTYAVFNNLLEVLLNKDELKKLNSEEKYISYDISYCKKQVKEAIYFLKNRIVSAGIDISDVLEITGSFANTTYCYKNKDFSIFKKNSYPKTNYRHWIKKEIGKYTSRLVNMQKENANDRSFNEGLSELIKGLNMFVFDINTDDNLKTISDLLEEKPDNWQEECNKLYHKSIMFYRKEMLSYAKLLIIQLQFSTNKESSIFNCQQALNFLESDINKENFELISEEYWKLGNIQYDLHKVDDAIISYKHAIRILEGNIEKNDYWIVSSKLFSLGTLLYWNEKYDDCVKCLEKCITYYMEEAKEDCTLCDINLGLIQIAYNQIIDSLFTCKKNNDVIYFCKKAIGLYDDFDKSLKDNRFLFEIYQEMGIAQLYCKQYRNAIKTFKQALLLKGDVNKENAESIARVYYRLAYAQKEIGKFKSSILSSLEAIRILQVYKKEEYSHLLAEIYEILGSSQDLSDKNADAAESYKKAIEVYKNIQDIKSDNIAFLFQMLGDNERLLGNFDAAIMNYQQAICLYEKNKTEDNSKYIKDLYFITSYVFRKKIDISICVQAIDKLLMSGKTITVIDMYEELEQQFHFVEQYITIEIDRKKKLGVVYDDACRNALKKIRKEKFGGLISLPCPNDKRQKVYKYQNQ